MFLDEELPRKKEGPEPRKLETLSVAELEEYVVWLEGEIARTREEAARKRAASAAADSFFKK